MSGRHPLHIRHYDDVAAWNAQEQMFIGTAEGLLNKRMNEVRTHELSQPTKGIRLPWAEPSRPVLALRPTS